MAADFKYDISGISELAAKLADLGKIDEGKGMRSAVRAGVKPIFTQAKANIPRSPDAVKTYKGRLVGPGFASRNIRTITQVKLDQGYAKGSVGVRAEAFYAVRFVERGTKKQAAQHWLTDASDQTKDAQLDAVATSLQKSITKYTK